MCRFGLLVSTCAYLRGRTATCAQLDYLCLTCAYLRYLCPHHLHTCCIENLPAHTCCTCGMISLSSINSPVLRNDYLTSWVCTHYKKYVEMSQNDEALLMFFWGNFKSASPVHQTCIKSARFCLSISFFFFEKRAKL